MATDLADQKLKTAILLLENMDDILLDLCREAFQFSTTAAHQPLGFVCSEADLRLLEVSREGYRNSNYSPQDMVDYLASFPDLRRYWLSVARTIVSWRSKAALQHTERYLRTKQLQDAGDESWRASVLAANAIANYGSAAALNAVTAKYRLVDDILNRLYDAIPELGTRQLFGDEYNDTLCVFFSNIFSAVEHTEQMHRQAIINISRTLGSADTPTMQQIEIFKSEL